MSFFALLSLLVLSPFLINAQVGENCLPTVSQNLQEQTLDGSTPVYLFVLNFTNTGFNTQFTESTQYSTANLPLNSLIFTLQYNPDNTTIVSTFGLTIYSSGSYGTTYTLNLNGTEIDPLESYLGAGYSAQGIIPQPEADSWGCDYSLSITTTTTTTSVGTTTHLGYPSTCNQLVCAECQVCIDDGGVARCITPESDCTPTTTSSSPTTTATPESPTTSSTQNNPSSTTLSPFPTTSPTIPSTTTSGNVNPSFSTTSSNTKPIPIPTTGSTSSTIVPDTVPSTTSGITEHSPSNLGNTTGPSMVVLFVLGVLAVFAGLRCQS